MSETRTLGLKAIRKRAEIDASRYGEPYAEVTIALVDEVERLRARVVQLEAAPPRIIDERDTCPFVPFDSSRCSMDLDDPCPVCGIIGHIGAPNLFIDKDRR